MRKNLTDRFCQTAKTTRGKRAEYADTNPNGWNLTLRVSETAKFWDCRYRFNGQRQRIGLGTFPAIALSKARQKSLEIGNLAKQGVDPKSKAEMDQRRERTVEQAARAYIEGHCKEHQKSWRQTERLFDKHILSRIGNIPLSELTRAHVLELMDDLTGEGLTVQVNRVVSQIKAFCNWAVEDREWIDVNPVASINRGKKKRFKERSRDRFLSSDEIRAIWDATSTYSQTARSFVRVLFLTGQRRDEVRLMAWSELDLEKGEWNLPASRTKNKAAHLVPLLDHTVDELKTLRAHYEDFGINPGDYVFTVAGRKPYAGLGRLKENLDRDSHVTDWVFHDCRRTFSTSLSRLGISPRDRRACLNHSVKDGLDKVYDLYDLRDEKAHAFDVWTKFLMQSVGEVDASNVVSFSK
jgi:integrase